MDHLFAKLAVIFVACSASACIFISPPPASLDLPDQTARQIIRERLSTVVITKRSELGSWAKRKFSITNAPRDADGGSAAPITDDGYFLTADHVLATAEGKNVFIIYAKGGRIVTSPARIVWRSYSGDLALLHIPEETPYFYQWTPPQHWLSPGYGIIHGGMATGIESQPGTLQTALSPERFFTGNRSFKIDVPLKPGDSGGPIVDAFGNLIGINSAVEFLIPMETAIFIDSEGNRPNTKRLAAIIRKDRVANRNR